MKHLGKIVVLVIGLAAFFSGCLAQQVNTPLPLNLDISPPASAVTKSVAAFSGTWVGYWEDTLASTLVVEKIDQSSASIVYSWGTASSWDINRPGFVRAVGKISANGLLSATLPNRAEVIYKLTPDQQSLEAQYIRDGRVTLGTFKRAQPTAKFQK
jgi:hypothetical protein